MSTRGYLLFRRRWCGALTAYYQHHDTYPTSLGKDLIDVLIKVADMEGKITPEKIVQELNSRGYNLQSAQRRLKVKLKDNERCAHHNLSQKSYMMFKVNRLSWMIKMN